ncbi:hypothetical protein [Hydrogenophaga sp. 5NK40-0174]|uniref:hypothetical protein n=1 Tax=Hydrogenophaga sp. 5NK40-0174 TaxID=3127649 RepID=UPI00310659D8
MQEKDLSALVSKTAALMEQLQRRSQALEQKQAEAAQALQQLTQQVPGLVSHAATQQLQRLPEAVAAKVEAGVDAPVEQYEQRLQAAGVQVQQSADTITAQLQSLQRIHHGIAWKLSALLLGTLGVLLAGGGWLSWQYRQDIRNNQISARLLEAYNRSDVVICGDSLCANVERNGRKFGDKGQYLPVKPR